MRGWVDGLGCREDLKKCVQNTDQQLWVQVQYQASQEYTNFLSLQRELYALQQAVANGGSLTPAQQQQLSQIQAPVSEYQEDISGFETVVANNGCAG
jgi:hypothetical protein